jgi:hypothetical protein
MSDPVFSALISLAREARNLEYKRSTSWTENPFRAKIAKSILAMSNIRDGGHIIIGMTRQAGDTYLAEGMQQDHLDSFSVDDVQSCVAQYADPYVQLTLTKEEDDVGQKYVWIQVQEFEEIPVICRKSYADILRGGKMYTRTRRRFESAEVPGAAEMREVMEMAVEKGIRAFLERARRAGVESPMMSGPTSVQSFEEQLRRGGL